jgi:hypothetical protein
MSAPLRIVIGFPCHGSVTAETTLSIAGLMLRVGLSPPEGMEFIRLNRYSSSNLSHTRAYLAEEAIKVHSATHILWIEADIAFPADSLHRLLAHGREIVGCNYTRRAPPYTPSSLDCDHKAIYTRDDSTGLEEAGTMGFGLMLVDLRVFAGLEVPWFSQFDQGFYCTEDVPWCRKVREAGHQLWLDHDLSKEVHHIGSIAFKNCDAVGG